MLNISIFVRMVLTIFTPVVSVVPKCSGESGTYDHLV